MPRPTGCPAVDAGALPGRRARRHRNRGALAGLAGHRAAVGAGHWRAALLALAVIVAALARAAASSQTTSTCWSAIRGPSGSTTRGPRPDRDGSGAASAVITAASDDALLERAIGRTTAELARARPPLGRFRVSSALDRLLAEPHRQLARLAAARDAAPRIRRGGRSSNSSRTSSPVLGRGSPHPRHGCSRSPRSGARPLPRCGGLGCGPRAPDRVIPLVGATRLAALPPRYRARRFSCAVAEHRRAVPGCPITGRDRLR